jgi:hypothetical protein
MNDRAHGIVDPAATRGQSHQFGAAISRVRRSLHIPQSLQIIDEISH